MKVKFVTLLLVVLFLLSISSCNSTKEELLFPNLLSRGSMIGVIYDDIVYYFDSETLSIKYQNINAVSDSGHPLINDPLLEAEANPFINMSIGTYMLIDYEGTAHNDNFPILIVAYKDFSDLQTPHYSIISFNTKSSEITVIKDDIYDNIQTLHLHNNIIYYTLNRGNKGYDMCRVDKNGKNFAVKSNPDNLLYRIHTIYNDKIYYSLDGLDTVYSCNLDFTEDTFLTEAVLKSDFFIYNDRFYYYSDLIESKLGNFPVFSADLMSFPLSDPSSAEVVLENITVGLNSDSKYYYYKSSPRIIADNYYDDGTSVLYVLDLDSGESTVFYEFSENNITYYEILSDPWIYFTSTDFSQMLDDPDGKIITDYFVINVDTMKKVTLPR